MESFLESRGRGDVVLYLSGAGAYGGDGGKEADALLCDAVARQGGVLAGAFGSLASLVQRLDESASDDRNADRKVWIILDALNEADRFSDLLGALDRFLPHVGERPWLRLVVSIRSGAYFERERKEKDQLVHGGAVFRNASCWAQFPTDRPGPFGQKRDVPYLEVRPFTSGREGAAAYRLRQERGGKKGSAIRYQDLPAGIRSLLLSPLHLHLFHESWAAETRVPPDLDEMGLFQKFLEKLSRDHPGLGERLHVLAEVMLERREALLPVEVAEKWEDDATRRVNSTAARLAKLSPVEELVGASILMRPVEEGQGSTRRLVGYRFSHQSLASAVLLGLLRIRLGGRALPTPPELLGWAREASGESVESLEPFDELVDAVAAFVVAVTKSGDGEAVSILLDLESEKVRNLLTNAGLVAYGPVRGSGNVPDAAAQRFWNTFCETAQTEARGIRLFDSSWQAQVVNETRGFSRAAMEIAEFRNVMLRAAASAQPGQLGYKESLAGSLLGLSDLRASFGRGAEAKELSEESLGLMRELVAAEPGRLEWSRDLAVTLGHLSKHRGHTGSFLEAQELSEESLALMRKVVAAEPERLDWKRTLTVSMDWASSLRASAGQRQEADVLSAESVAAMRELVAAEPGRLDWWSDLAHSLNGRSYLMESLGRGAEAEALVEESRELMRELVATEPRRLDWKSSLADFLVRLSCLRNAVGRGAEAEDLEESLGLMRELVTAEPERSDWKSDLTDVLAFLGDLRARAGRDADAKDLLEECLALRRQLVAAEPESLRWRRALAYALDGMGALSARSGRGIEAESFQEESTALMREYVAAAPESQLARRELAAVLVSLGISRLNVGRKAEAETLLEESLALRRALVASDPGRVEWRNDLSLSLFAASRTRERSGNRMGALAAAQEEVVIVRELLKSSPECLEYRRHFVAAVERASVLLDQSGEVEAAAELRLELSELHGRSET
jgi:tetratricopeptide (TPR) repeat protein